MFWLFYLWSLLYVTTTAAATATDAAAAAATSITTTTTTTTPTHHRQYHHYCTITFSFYRAKRSVARYCHGKLSVRLSLRQLYVCRTVYRVTLPRWWIVVGVRWWGGVKWECGRRNASFLFRSLHLPYEVSHWLYILKFTRLCAVSRRRHGSCCLTGHFQGVYSGLDYMYYNIWSLWTNTYMCILRFAGYFLMFTVIIRRQVAWTVAIDLLRVSPTHVVCKFDERQFAKQLVARRGVEVLRGVNQRCFQVFFVQHQTRLAVHFGCLIQFSQFHCSTTQPISPLNSDGHF